MYFFQLLGDEVDNIFSFIENGATSDLMNQLTVLFSASITILIMIKAYQFLAGKSQEPVKDLIWDITLKMIIITFALNIGGWLDLVTDAMEGINQWAGGGVSLFAELDELLQTTVKLENALSTRGNYISSFFYGLLVYLGFLIGALPALFIVITTAFTLKILIMLAPFMIFTLFYGWLKNMFTQWLSLFFANTLTVLIVSLILSAVIDTFKTYQIFLIGKVSSIDPFLTSIQVLILGLLLFILVGVGKYIAEKISSVSMESIMTSEFGKALDPAKKFLRRKGK